MDLNTITEIARPRQRADLPAWRDGDAWLAGGTWLFFRAADRRSRRLIDIADLRLARLQIDASKACASRRPARSPNWMRMTLPPTGRRRRCSINAAASFLASFKIWNMATVGGNICMALPAGPMISLTAALDGVCTIWTPDGKERRVAVLDFVLGAATQRAGAR